MKLLKAKYIFLTLAVVLILGYTIGQFLPIEYLHPTVLEKNITINDLYARIISTIGTFATVSAVVIALFKEDIRKRWEKADLSATFRDDDELQEVLDNESSSSNYKAKKYESSLVVKNNGNLAAKGCFVILERLQFATTITSFQEIPVSGLPLDWTNNINQSVLIPATGKATVNLVEITSPESQSVPTEQSESTVVLPKIRIGNCEPPNSSIEGKWLAHFKVYSENALPIEFIISISWDKKWENRITEMKKSVTISKEIQK